MSKIRVAITQRVLSPYRVPFFERLSKQAALVVKLFYGREIKGTKLKSVSPAGRFNYQKLFTLNMKVSSSGRSAPLILHPGLFWALVRFSPDVILCEGSSNFLNNLTVYIYALLFGRKIVWWSLGQLIGRKYRGLSSIYLSIVLYMERRADAWLAYSTEGKNYFISQGYPPNKVFKAINCVDTDRVFDSIKNISPLVKKLRKRYNLIGKQAILFVGSITPEKRVERLVRAFANLRKSHSDAVLLIVGDGKELESLRSLAVELGVEGQVILAGEVREGVAAYFQVGRIFVLPGLGGLAIGEAMAHGLPVICTQADGTEKDYVVNEVTGQILPEDSDDNFVNNLTHVLCEFLNQPEKVAQMGENARELIKKRLNINAYISDVTHCLKTVAGVS